MATGALSIFVNSLESTPLCIPIKGKYVVINPKDIKMGKVSKVFAIFREEGIPIQMEVDALTAIGPSMGLVLDSTSTNEFFIVGERESSPSIVNLHNSNKVSKSHDGASDRGYQEGTSKNAEIFILDSSSSNDEMSEPSKRQLSPSYDEDTNYRSAIEFILTHPNKYSSLHRLVTTCETISKVKEVPIFYDGDVLFELPPARGGHSSMEGMEQRFDGHCWVKPVLSRINFPATIRRSKCGGHLQCTNDACPFKVSQGIRNEKSWIGKLTSEVQAPGLLATDYGTLRCFYCHSEVILLRRCEAYVMYVLGDGDLSRMFIHRGHHAHPVMDGIKRSTLLATRELVQRFINTVPHAAARQVQMSLAKDIILRSFMPEHTYDQRHNRGGLEPTHLCALLEELEPLVATNKFRHMVKELKVDGAGGVGLESKLLQLKRGCIYPFFQSMIFSHQSTQQEERSHVFKMSTSGPGSGVDIVERMR